MGKNHYVVGIDISDTSLHLVQMSQSMQGPELMQCHSRVLPKGCVEGGLLRDIPTLTEILYEMAQEMGLRKPRAVSAVAGAQTYTRSLRLPLMPQAELRRAARLQALDFMPVPLEETVTDVVPWRILNGDTEKYTDLFFIAVRRRLVLELERLCLRAGFRLMALETEADALLRLLPEGSVSPLAVIYLEPGRSFLCLAYEHQAIFYRQLHWEADRSQWSSSGLASISLNSELKLEIERCLDDFGQKHLDLACQNLWICGPAANKIKVSDFSAHIAHCRIESWQPWGALKRGQSSNYALEDRFLLAYGMAMRY